MSQHRPHLLRPRRKPDRTRSVLVAHPSADLYGSDRVLLETVRALVESGRQVVVSVPGPGPLVAELTARGARVELCPTPVIRKSALRPRGFARLLLEVGRSVVPACRLVARWGRGGVYVNTVTIPLWLVLGRLLRRRVVCHVHEAEGSAAPLVRLLIALPLLLASRIVVNSSYSLDVLASAVPRLRRRSTVVYNGVPGPPTVVPARAELQPPVRLLFVGRLSPRKGPQVAVAALDLLRRDGVDASLGLLGAVYPGYEWFEAELRATVAAAGLDGAVDFLGFDADVWPYVAAADVVLVPSVVDEPFGNTAVEAVLAARPLVVSATSGLREASAGYRCAQSVEPDRPEALAAAVQAVVADWDRYRRLALADSALARERHATDRYAAEVVAVLTGPVTGTGPAGG